MASYYNQTTREVLVQFQTDPDTGLSELEVAKRQQQYGKNALQVVGTPLWRRLLAPFLDIFMAVLFVALGLSLIQGNFLEAATIAVIIAVDAVIYYAQQASTNRILRTLKHSTVQKNYVLRAGEERLILATDLVPGDIVILREGDKVPADGRIISESGLLTNESMLTGESEGIAKDARAIGGEKKIFEQRNMVFSGSFVITGSGKIIVTATGNHTEYGRIASLASSAQQSSPIEAKIHRLVIKIAVVVILLAGIAFIMQLVNGINMVDALKFTLAMVVSAVPEGLPIAISIILALAAARMAKQQALVKELKAIQSIGVVTTVASDKTGTLTKNRLEMQVVWPLHDQQAALLTLYGAKLSSTSGAGQSEFLGIDPLDVCIASYIDAHKIAAPAGELIKTYAFDQKLKLSGNLYRGQGYTLYLKGAPEVVIERSELKAATKQTIMTQIDVLADQGYKVIALARAPIDREINELTRLKQSDRLEFVGLIGVADAVRPEAAKAIRRNLKMGVKTKMITGDHANTAFSIGKELGLVKSFSEVLDCSELIKVTDDALAEMVKEAVIFARVTPEGKYRLLEAIKHTEICAMTGDGVNDVPALVGANVGIAMGDSPAIVQDAGDIILLNNDFKNITVAIKESRTVLANIRRMLTYLLATNAGEVLTMLGALIFSHGHLLSPIQILWINLVTDSLMVIPIGLEPAEEQVLRNKPESKDAPILPGFMIRRMIITAVIMASFTLGTYFVTLNITGSAAQANTLAFVALVVMQWSSAVTARGIHDAAWKRVKVKHHSFHAAMFVAIILQLLAIFGPLRTVLGIVPVPPVMLGLVALVTFVGPFIIIEGYKKWQERNR